MCVEVTVCYTVSFLDTVYRALDALRNALYKFSTYLLTPSVSSLR